MDPIYREIPRFDENAIIRLFRLCIATEHTNVRSPFSSAGEGIKEENNLLFPGRLKAVSRRTKTAVLTLSRGYREGE